MTEGIWIKHLNEAIAFILLAGMGIILYRGLKKNHSLLSEREELLKRYLLFRGDIQVRIRVYGEDERLYQELLKNLSESWKNFKKASDQYLHLLLQNTVKTKRYLQLIVLGLALNSGRLLIEAYLFSGLQSRFINVAQRELSNYVLVVLGFFLLRNQTHRFLSLKGESVKMEREVLFYSNSLNAIGEKELLYDEFAPIEEGGAVDGKKD